MSHFSCRHCVFIIGQCVVLNNEQWQDGGSFCSVLLEQSHAYCVWKSYSEIKRCVMSNLHVYALLMMSFSFIISHYYIFSMAMTSASIWCPFGTVENCVSLNRFGEALQNALIS